jgi:hypothetical protein
LLDLAVFAIRHALGGLYGSDPLIPFTLDETEGRRRLSRFALETLEGSAAAALDHAFGVLSSVDRVAVAYDGFVTVAGTRSEAILVRAADRSEHVSHVFAQRYTRRNDDLAVEIDNVAYLGHEPHF